MKLLVLLLLLTSCASNYKEPWAVGDCVEYAPRKEMGIIRELFIHGSTAYYNIEYTYKDPKEKVLTKINCKSIPHSLKGN